jgi:hypothetical protein
MNTPAHVVLNATVLGRGRWRQYCLPITAGALLPDLPMVIFYLYERVITGAPEHVIWSRAYFTPGWQGVFDASHSFPLIGAAALIAWRLGAQSWLALLASMALHSIADLPLHNDDAHAHFFPLSPWRFHSPISYWDPHHHGTIFLAAEVLLVIGGSVVLLRRSEPRAWRVLGAVILVSYVALLIFAIVTWGPA